MLRHKFIIYQIEGNDNRNDNDNHLLFYCKDTFRIKELTIIFILKQKINQPK